MKKFARHRTIDEILEQCNAQNVPVDIKLYVNGSDHITIGEVGRGHAIYNTVNGRFFGKTPDGIEFCSDSVEHDALPWMQSLLSFFW